MVERCRYSNQQRFVALEILVLSNFLFYASTTYAFCHPCNRYCRSDNSMEILHDRGTLDARAATTFLRSTKNTPNLVDFIDSIATILTKPNMKKDEKALGKKQRERKDLLLSLVQIASNEPTFKVVPLSDEINQAIDSLAEVSPITSTDELVQQLNRTWYLVWTTEKEINLFLEKGWSTKITQQISSSDSLIINTIPFVNDNGYFGVRGRIFRKADDPMIRTQFTFETATLQLKQFSWLPTLTFPPVGKGWFDTVYLDSNFRVDRNSRNDILICQSSE
jgi:PAP_fibrillin